MTLTFTSPTDDILVQDGTLAYNYIASGSISAGQLVYPKTNAMTVHAVDGLNKVDCVGVAAYDVTHGEYVAVYGPGNIVRCQASGTVTCGDQLGASYNGQVHTLTATTTTGIEVGVALETVSTTAQVRVLLT